MLLRFPDDGGRLKVQGIIPCIAVKGERERERNILKVAVIFTPATTTPAMWEEC